MNTKDIIKSERQKLNISQEALADKVGVSRRLVQKWEYGESKPDIEQAHKLASIFNISITEFTGDEDNSQSNLQTDTKTITIPSIKFNKYVFNYVVIVVLLLLSWIELPYSLIFATINVLFCFKTKQNIWIKIGIVFMLAFLAYTTLGFFIRGITPYRITVA